MILSFHTATFLDSVPTISPFENTLSNQGRRPLCWWKLWRSGLEVWSGGLHSLSECVKEQCQYLTEPPRIQGAAYHWDTR